jgi:hypothetical protein
VNPIRRGSAMLFVLMGISLLGMGVNAQVSVVDTVKLALVPPDSVYVKRVGATLVVGWYPPVAALSQATGSRNYTQWYLNNNPSVSRVNILGRYTGTIDRTLLVHKNGASTNSDTIGTTRSIPMLAELVDRLGNKETYAKEFNLGTNFNTFVGDSVTVPMALVGLATGDTLKTGVTISFKRGIIDNSVGPGLFDVDLQTFEGFNVWRGLSPLPSHMEVIEELSRDNAMMGIVADSVYFKQWPKKDAHGRDYFEFVDDGVFAGFTYFYDVTCFDKGYFLGKYQRNKVDNFICDEDPANPATPGHPVLCENVARRVAMTVSNQNVMRNIYAVPNPYRTGTSAETTPSYHNFPDLSIKLFNVPTEAEVRIFTLSGDLVFQTHHSSPDGSDGIVSWNVKNMHGQEVGSGVYILKVTSPAGHIYGRICVIR